MPMHLNSFDSGVDVPEAVVDRRHRRHRQGISGEGKAYVRRGLKPKLSTHFEIPDLASDDEDTTASEHTENAEELPVPACTPSTLDVEAEAWPSLRQAAEDWDFCSEQSETSEVPSEASIVTSSSWIPVGSTAKSYAASLLTGYPTGDQKPQQWPTVKKSTVAASKTTTTSESVKAAVLKEQMPESDIESDECGDLRQKGWQKTHKTSFSMAARKKLAYQTARRAEQRRMCKE